MRPKTPCWPTALRLHLQKSLSAQDIFCFPANKMINHELEDINVNMHKMNARNEDFGVGKGERNEMSFFVTIRSYC
jgi:hypothetical protein